MPALFGWQGLALEHPDDWAPVALSGDRKSGYARLANPRSLSLQIRWAPAGHETLDRSLGRYLDRLVRDASRKRQEFSRDVCEVESILCYRYRGEIDGEGMIFPTNDGRVAFIEAVGDSSTARTRALNIARASFSTGGERWSVLGLDFSLPGPLRVEKKEFLAGRTSLTLVGRSVRVTAERWGLAESLLTRLSLEEWAHARLGRGWIFDPSEPPARLHGERRSLFGFDEIILVHQPESNQIVLLRSQSRHQQWRPQWDWLT